MKKIIVLLIFLVGGVAQAQVLPKEYVAVANRGGSSVSIIDASSLSLIKTIDKDILGFEFEPMYVSDLKNAGMFAVGDRKNSQVLFFDKRTGEMKKAISTSKGVFHQWAYKDKLVLVADQDNAVDVISIATLYDGGIGVSKKTLKLSSVGHSTSTPHDVILDKTHFFVSLHTKNSENESIDLVLKVNLDTLNVEGELEFTEDVHLGLPSKSGMLLVLEQSTGVLNLIDRKSFKTSGQVPNLLGAHGVYWSDDANKILVANIRSRGASAVYALESQAQGFKEAFVGDTNFTTPHNITADFKKGFVYVTHSGSNNTVSILNMKEGLNLVKAVETGNNPFGLALISRK